MTSKLLDIVGHHTQRKALERLLHIQKLPNTMLFSGARGTGKGLVGLELARTLLCEQKSATDVYGGCGECRSCHLFDSRNLADLHQIECASTDDAQIESIRELLYTLQLRSFEGKSRIVIFHDAHEISTQVTNVLLKALEEPRPDTYFILITSNRSKLLPTLLSRCHTFHFESLTPKEIEEVIQRKKLLDLTALGQPAREALIQLADGSLDTLASVEEMREEWERFGDRILSVFEGRAQEIVPLAAELSKEKEKLSDLLRLLRIFFRSQMLLAPPGPQQYRWAIGLTNLLSAERLILDRNLGASYVFNVLLTELLPGQGRSPKDSPFDEPQLIEEYVL